MCHNFCMDNEDDISSADRIRLELTEALSQLDTDNPAEPSESALELNAEDGLGHTPAKEALESDK